MSEVQKKTFESRVRKVDPDFKPSVWRRWRTRERRKLYLPMRATSYAIVFTYIALTAVKVTMERELGPGGYDARVAAMASGGETSRIASKLMFRDPIMTYVSKQI